MTITLTNKRRFRIVLALTALAGLVLLSACHRGESGTTATGEGSSTPKAAPSPQTQFEKDLQEVRNSSFQHVWLISRKDGKALDSKDSNFLRTNAPQVIDWVTTDDGRKVFAGTNFDLELAGLNLIKKRFVVEDYTGK
ncbi:MAG TPA: hypothetical protein VN643_13660 [Pyrinomonadaceae bacterium]|nr:hypothetical protein [Pyrinomonadaceae bacterium]